jgi:hypothetical protein
MEQASVCESWWAVSAEALPRLGGRGATIGYWITTGLFTAMMTLSAVMYLTQPMMAQAFAALGFPQYFRVELACAKLIGVATLLAPVPSRFKEWAYAGFGITLISAMIAHTTVQGADKAIPPLIAFALLAASYGTRMKRG